ncbi:MAG: tRNA (guanosine(46)-N7)-methyltransferase TrmB [Rhodospirillales bacterium]|nr:MAG: tRNA (guanosine(46)-N7)-methyltransferase TrmB [Rhodospirillales bacterium]
MTGRDGPRFHGRRHGRRLRGGRRALLETLLPDVRLVPPSSTGAMEPAALFPQPVNDIWLEIGFGAGEHMAAMASRHPEIGFIGCEPYVNGVASLLARIARDGCRNIRVFDDDARLLLPHLPAHCVGRVFLLFPDPWPKRRHADRRFVSAATLNDLARVMRPGGEFRFASDDGGYVSWTLEHVIRHPAFAWTPSGCDDWRLRPVDAVPTRYEQKALARGARCAYLRFVCVSRPALPGALRQGAVQP